MTHSIKKIAIMVALFCAVDSRAVIPELVGIATAATPFLFGAIQAKKAYEATEVLQKMRTPSEAKNEYLGSFVIGLTPGVNLALKGMIHPPSWDEDYNTIMRTGWKAGLATYLSIPAGIFVYQYLKNRDA